MSPAQANLPRFLCPNLGLTSCAPAQYGLNLDFAFAKTRSFSYVSLMVPVAVNTTTTF